MTFEEWCKANEVGEEALSDPDTREDREEEYREEMEMEAERVQHFGAEWLNGQRKGMDYRVNEVLRILNDGDDDLECKHSWLYTQIGELEYALHIGIMPERKANRMKDKLFGAYTEAVKRDNKQKKVQERRVTMSIEDLLTTMRAILAGATALSEQTTDSIWAGDMKDLQEEAEKLSALAESARLNHRQIVKLGADGKQLGEANKCLWDIQTMEHDAWENVQIHKDFGMI